MTIASVKANDLAAGLQKVIKVRNTNAILPSLECVHVKTIKRGLVLTCSDLENVVQTGIKAEVQEVGKEFLIPMRAQNILQQLKDVDIEITNGKALTFNAGGNVFSVPVEKPEDFPIMPKVEATAEFEIEDPVAFLNLLRMHKGFTSKDDLRPAMMGVFMTNKVMASTNAHQLCASSVKVLPYKTDIDFKAILPKRFIDAMPAIKDKMKVKINAEHIQVTDKETKIISRLISATFPDYKVVIPKDNDLHIKMDRLALITNVRLALQMSNKSTKQVVFHWDISECSYNLNASDIDFGEEINVKGRCECVKNGPELSEFKIAYNGNFLLQALEEMESESVTFQMLKPSVATNIQSAGNLFLIMPLMLND